MFTHVLLVAGLTEPCVFNTLCAQTDCVSVVFFDLEKLNQESMGILKSREIFVLCTAELSG